MGLTWTPDARGDYTATTHDFILVAYRTESGAWRWIAMLADGSFEPAGESERDSDTFEAARAEAEAWAGEP
jgi:hypothetical protein